MYELTDSIGPPPPRRSTSVPCVYVEPLRGSVRTLEAAESRLGSSVVGMSLKVRQSALGRIAEIDREASDGVGSISDGSTAGSAGDRSPWFDERGLYKLEEECSDFTMIVEQNEPGLSDQNPLSMTSRSVDAERLDSLALVLDMDRIPDNIHESFAELSGSGDNLLESLGDFSETNFEGGSVDGYARCSSVEANFGSVDKLEAIMAKLSNAEKAQFNALLAVKNPSLWVATVHAVSRVVVAADDMAVFYYKRAFGDGSAYTEDAFSN